MNVIGLNLRSGQQTGSHLPLASFFVLAGLVFVSLSPSLVAQSVYGKIQGTVRDASGEPRQAVALTAVSEEKGIEFHTRTDQRGHYQFSQLLPDTYDIRAQAQELKVVAIDISVSADRESLVDLTLPTAGQGKTVVGGSMLSTRNDNSITLDRNAISNLPNFDQNSTRFGFLAPGTQLRGANAISAQDPQNSLQLSINGEQPSGTAVVVDGTDNRDSINQLAVFNSTLESLAELSIVTQSFDAETGQALSGVVIAQTRSGGNAWHGSAFEFRRSSWAEASNPNLQNPSLAVSPEFKVNLFGGALGGPIVRKRLFIFGDYQGTRRSLGSTQVLNVPTQKVRDTCFNQQTPCDLSEYLLPSGTQVFDPQTYNSTSKTEQAFAPIAGCANDAPGLCIPANRISPQAVALLSLLPAPNIANATVANYQVAGAEAWDDDAFNVRVDESLKSNLSLFGRLSYASYRVNGPSAFGNLLGGKGFGPDGFAGQARSPNYGLSSGFDYALRPSLLTDFRFGFFRRKITVLPNSYNTTPMTNAGILGLNLDAVSSGMPLIQLQQPTLQVVGSNINFGDGQQVNQCNCPQFETLQQFQWVNNWVEEHGNHVFKWGEDFRFANDTSFLSFTRRAGVLSFLQKDTANVNTPTGQLPGGLGLATFLIGDVSSFSRSLGDAPNPGIHQKRLFFYGQDTWRATQKLTVSYGLRWEIYFPQVLTTANSGGFLNLNTGMIQVPNSGGVDLTGNAAYNWHNFAPRVGFAYQLKKATVLRAAYGRNYDAGLSFARVSTLNPPALISQSVQPTGTCGPPQCITATSPFEACVSCVFQFDGSVPAPPNFPTSGMFALPAQVAAFASTRLVKVPTLDQWNLAVQHELGPDLSFELGYVGNNASHVLPNGVGGAGQAINLNQPTIANFALYGCYQITSANQSNCFGRYPYFKQFGWTQGITYIAGISSADYNALQAKLTKRFSKGFEFHANYTWSKGIAYQFEYYAQDPALNRGVNPFDRTHTFNFYNVFELPFGRGKPFLADVNRAVNYLVGGWSLNTITTWASGLPFSPTYIQTACTHDRDTGPCRPNLVGTVHITGDRNNYFTTTGGQTLSAPGMTIGPWQRPQVGTFGTAGFNSLRGPSYFDTDLVLAKNLPLTERQSLQFRADFVNVFNRVNLGLPSGCVDCNASGTQTGAVITTLTPNAGQRQIEFALRFMF